MASRSSQIAAEQRQLDRFYARLDELRARSSSELEAVERQGASGTPQARSERDALATHYAARLRALTAAEFGLCFGRIDLLDGERHYIGRVGLSDEDHHSMLVDWRAPAAQAFYQATPASPQGLTRRRHLRLRQRQVVGVDDDLLDAKDLGEDERETLSGEAALLASLNAKRTGQMGDIVATIQGEQDRIIRSDARGMLVVQGGPGTGKTAVALHRAAYLLYTHRERLARAGVLVVAPNTVFLRYIDQVLPSLGETGVLLATPEQMVPGVTVTGRDSEPVARLKGDARMAEVIAEAALQRKRVPKTPVVIPYESEELVLTRRVAISARRRAINTRRRHNAARSVFLRGILDSLVSQAQAAATDTDPAEVRWLQRELLAVDELRDAIDAMWPRLSATQLIEELFADRALLEASGQALTPQERELLHRPPGSPWTAADVPLLDEAFSLLGDPMEQVRRAAERRRQAEERRYAQEVLALTGTSAMVDADTLAARFRDSPAAQTLAERSAADPDATFGHVIVDEAQELSPMMWRLLLRRCPSRSMTIVGDVAQSSSAAAVQSWADVLDEVAPDRWRLAELSVNYRTPSEIMAVAADVLASARPGMAPPRSVRDAGILPRALVLPATAAGPQVAQAVARTAREELAAVGEGTVAVIVPEQQRAALAEELTELLPDLRADGRPDALDGSLVLLDVHEIKGLEFDAVVVVDPQAILDGSARGASDLYVALTRPTARMAVVSCGPLPKVLHRLQEGAAARIDVERAS